MDTELSITYNYMLLLKLLLECVSAALLRRCQTHVFGFISPHQYHSIPRTNHVIKLL